jgi:predicted deacylase
MEPTHVEWRETIERGANEGECLPSPAGAYPTPAGILGRCDRLAREHGGRPERIGESVEGRPIWSLRFGPDRPGGALLISLLHACEYVGPLALLAVARRILSAGSEIPLALVPIANPDGAERAHKAALDLSPRFYRGNARGVDLNRNFPTTHRRGGLWGSLPWYRSGPHPASEPETAAVVGLARALRPDRAISFHSFGRWIFFPPAHRREPWPRTPAHRRAIEAAGGVAAIGYRTAQLGRWAFWFRAHGTEIDFLAGEIGAQAYLVEVSRGGIGRWGLRRLCIPFFAYNPPSPESEVDRLAGMCACLMASPTE